VFTNRLAPLGRMAGRKTGFLFFMQLHLECFMSVNYQVCATNKFSGCKPQLIILFLNTTFSDLSWTLNAFSKPEQTRRLNC